MSELARFLAGDNYLNRSASGLKRGLSALADSLVARSNEGTENMQAALSGVRVKPGAILTDAGYVMPDASGQPDFAQVGMEREPDVLRALELFGGAMTPAKGAAIAAKAGTGGKVSNTLPWRDLPEVSREVGVSEISPHTYDFANFMQEMRGKVADNGLSDRDLLKAYGITAASIGRTGRSADAVRRAGLNVAGEGGSVRPEGAFAEWMLTPQGQKFLDSAEKGVVDEEALSGVTRLFGSGAEGGAGFGKQNQLAEQLRAAVVGLPQHKGAIEAALLQDSHEPLREAMMAIPGVNASKAGFISSLLGNGSMPTLDARQIILHTGESTDNAAKVLSRKGAAAKAVDTLAERQRQMALSIPKEFEKDYQHLAHHTVWDATSGTKTTHEDLIRSMRLAANANLGPIVNALLQGYDRR